MRMGATEDAASRRPEPTLDMDAHRESGSVGGDQRAHRPVLVLGLLPAGLAFARSLGRAGIPVHGGVFRGHEFGLRSRYLRSRCVAVDALEEERDRRMLAFLRTLSAGERTILVPERDEHVDFVLRNWDEVLASADVPLPADPEIVRRLRRKDLLPAAAAEAGIAAPGTRAMLGPETLAEGALEPPYLLKPVEGQEFALMFGKKAAVAETDEAALVVWQEANAHGFELILQELVPDSHEQVFSLFTYVGRDGEPLASVVGRKVRQGPLRFGTSAVFETKFDPEVLELGLRLLRTVGYRGFAHVEFALDPRDGAYKVLEVNTRLPVWAGIAMKRSFDIGRVAYDDLSGIATAPREPLQEDLAWVYLAKDLWVSAQMARRRELSIRGFLSHHVRTGKVGAVFAADDPLPALASVGYLRSRL
jgi:D-aspartate ligase